MKRLLLGCILLAGWWLAPFSVAGATNEAPKAKLKISGYGFFGNRSIKRTLQTLELAGKKPEYFGSAFVEDSALLIAARLRRDGYLKPRILLTLTTAEGGRLRIAAADLLENPLPPSMKIKRVEFRISKGKFYHFDSLAFDGLETVPPRVATGYFMETEALLRLKGNRVFTPERLQQGLSSLRDVLDRQGYREAKVEAAAVDLNDRTGGVNVRVSVSQGPRFVVRSVREEYFIQDTNRPAEIRQSMPNQNYSRVWVQDYTLSLKTNLYRRGYPDVAVDLGPLVREGRTNAAGPGSLGTAAPLTGTNTVMIDLLARVISGPQVTIGAIEFQGERHTSRSLMTRRVRIQRGDRLNPVRVEEGRHRLAQLGIFESVDADFAPISQTERGVVYRVKEGKRLDVSLLFGYGSYELLRGGVEVQQRNIWGLAHFARLKAVQSFKATSGEFVYTVPELVGRDVDIFANGTGLRREEVSFTREEYGGGAGVHKYFKRQSTDAILRYNYQILNALDTFRGVATEGLTNPAVGSVIAEIKHDLRDNPLLPRRGYKVFGSFETASRGLGGDANYERIEIFPSFHQPLGGGRYLSLGVSHGVAVSFGSPGENLPFNKRFFPGGDNSMRGYPEGEASPRNERGEIVGAETYTLATVEFEQALTRQWSLVLFSDSVGFSRRLENYPFDTGLFSVGGGIRWKTIVGPVRLEYGHNLNPREHDPDGTLHFSLGFPF